MLVPPHPSALPQRGACDTGPPMPWSLGGAGTFGFPSPTPPPLDACSCSEVLFIVSRPALCSCLCNMDFTLRVAGNWDLSHCSLPSSTRSLHKHLRAGGRLGPGRAPSSLGARDGALGTSGPAGEPWTCLRAGVCAWVHTHPASLRRNLDSSFIWGERLAP